MRWLVLIVMLAGAQARAATEVPRGRYIAGGIVGSAVGFGAGHGIMGTYGEIGWVFTVGEGAGLALALSAVGIMWYEVFDHVRRTDGREDFDPPKSFRTTVPILMASGVLLSTGFRIWEIIDVWTRHTPTPKGGWDRHGSSGGGEAEGDGDFSLRAMPLVLPDGGGALFAVTF